MKTTFIAQAVIEQLYVFVATLSAYTDPYESACTWEERAFFSNPEAAELWLRDRCIAVQMNADLWVGPDECGDSHYNSLEGEYYSAFIRKELVHATHPTA